MICDQCVKIEDGSYLEKDMRMDRIVTHKVWGFLCMIVLLALIFWITIAGANVPSAYLSAFFVQLEAWLHQACEQLHVAKLLEGLFVDGMGKDSRMGHCRHVATYGYFLSLIHLIRRLWLSSAYCL